MTSPAPSELSELSKVESGEPTMDTSCFPLGNDGPTQQRTLDEIVVQFRETHIQEVVDLVSGMFERVVEMNDQIPFDGSFLTRFHSRSPPGISVRDYLLRIIKFCSLDKVVLLVVLYYIDLFSRCYPGFCINSLTVHRFIITSVTVASKGLCDAFCTNKYYSKVGGISQVELNLLEVDFLTRTNYCIVPPPEVLANIYSRLLEQPVQVVATPPNELGEHKHERSVSANAESPGFSDQSTLQPHKHPSKFQSMKGTVSRILHPAKKQKGLD